MLRADDAGCRRYRRTEETRQSASYHVLSMTNDVRVTMLILSIISFLRERPTNIKNTEQSYTLKESEIESHCRCYYLLIVRDTHFSFEHNASDEMSYPFERHLWRCRALIHFRATPGR